MSVILRVLIMLIVMLLLFTVVCVLFLVIQTLVGARVVAEGV